MSLDYDLVVIGGGSGGVRAARVAATLGARVALIEARDLGGTCVNLGCVPKKLFSYASHFGEHFEDGVGYGWTSSEPRFDWAALVQAKNREISRLNGVYQRLLVGAGVEVISGHGTVRDRHIVVVNGRDLGTERILVATGGRPWRPAIPGAQHALVSDDLFHMETLPARMVIVGGGYVAVEFASIFAGLGVAVTLLYRGELFLRGFDDEIRAALADEMRKRGIAVHFDAPIAAVEDQGRCAVCVDGTRHPTDAVLLATGREPLVDGMGLEVLGVEIGRSGIRIDADFQSTVHGIYAVGDCADRGPNNDLALTPVALAEGMVLAHNLFGDGGRKMDYADVPTAIFTTPNLATVGLSEQAARASIAHGRVYVERFRPMLHTLSGRDEQILMKLVVDDETDRVVGAHMMGPDAGELIQGLAVAIRAGARKADFDSTIGIHPTAAEEFVTMRTVTRTW